MRSTLYIAWISMRQRCNNPNCRRYKHYGGRGIFICIRWDTFANFSTDMGPHPGKGWTLGRKDNNKIYCRSNSRWETKIQQNRNRSLTKLTVGQAAQIRVSKGNAHTVAQRFGISHWTVYDIRRGRRWA